MIKIPGVPGWRLLYVNQAGDFFGATKRRGNEFMVNLDGFGLYRFLQKGADHTAVSEDGKTILHICASSGNISTFNVLTAARLSGIDVDAMDGNSLTARDYLKQRKDITEGLEIAFEELIESIHQEIIEDTDIESDHYEDALEE